jgi:23S rRNA (uracil1939-C5)-methyltransferase
MVSKLESLESHETVGGAGERIVCEHADRCGGCPIIALPYGEQLALKRGRVVQSLARYPALEPLHTAPVHAATPIVSYRTRAKLIVAPGGKIGLFAKGGGHQVIDIPNCRVLSAPLARVAEMLRARVAEDERDGGALAPFDGGLGSFGGHAQTPGGGAGALRAVDLREVQDGGKTAVLLTLVLQRDRVRDVEAVRAAARALMAAAPEIAGVAANFHDGDAPQILGSETTVLAGAASSWDKVGGSKHLATFGSFVQAHRGQAETVHAILADALPIAQLRAAGAHLQVLDLYGGSGAIALGLAALGAEVTLVESFPPAAQQATAAAEAQRLAVKVECADVAGALKSFKERGLQFDAAIVNPPRRGMSAMAREWLSRFTLDLVAYVSCDPDTLGRDLDHFARLGYRTDSLRPLDMIPLTDEVETVAILRQTHLPTPPVVFEDADVIIVEKGPHEPVTPQGEYACSLLARVRQITGAENAVPLHRIDIGTSGLVMFARRAELVSKWQDAMSAANTRKIYVAATRGVTPSKGAITRELREDGKLYSARTRYRRLAVASGHSVLRVIPEQGRTHQIRRHLAAIGHPVLGDERYGHAPTNRFFEEKNGLDRPFLHCVRIEIDHPDTRTRLVVEAPMPGDLRAVLERTAGPGTLRFLDHKNALGTSAVSSLPPPPDSSGFSSLPPPPDSLHHRGHPLDVDSESPPTIRPPITGDDDPEPPSRF